MADLPVDISYHKQKSSTARIRDGRIRLRISSLVSRREQQRHIQELLVKMEGLAERIEEKEKIGFFKESGGDDQGSRLESREVKLSTGVDYEIEFKKGQVKHTKVQKIGQKLIVLSPVGKEVDVEQCEAALWKFLAKDQLAAVEQRLRELRQGWISEDFSQVRLRQVISRWGSCDKQQGIIMLSVKLLLLEQKLLDYVCIHELAHLRYADHSDLFWDLVSKKMPYWKVQRARLRGFE